LAEQKELRTLMSQRDKELAELENQRRAEARGDVRINQDFKEKKEARLEKLDEKIIGVKGSMADALAKSEAARAGKTPTDLTIVANNYLQAQRDLGDKRPDAVIRREGINEHVRLKASYDPRFAGIAATQQTAAEAQDAAAQRAALTAMTARLREPDALINRMDLRDKDEANKKAGKPSTLEADYVRGIYDEAYGSMRGNSAAPAPAAAPAAAAAPAPRAAPTAAPASAGPRMSPEMAGPGNNDSLTPEKYKQQLIAQNTQVVGFNEVLPSLNDIFIHLVEGTHANTRAFQNVQE
jgi:hypothetical protein